MWVAVLEAAKEWGIPPWRVEEEATAEWWDRWMVMRQEQPKPKKRMGKGG